VSKLHTQVDEFKSRFTEGASRVGPMLLSPQFQSLVFGVIFIWASFSASALIWAFWPRSPIAPMPAVVLNPANPAYVIAKANQVALPDMLGLGLFGIAAGATSIGDLELIPDAVPDGIEKGAQDTRLDLILVGTLADSEPDAGTAIIEVAGKQAAFAVGDELPISARVRLAKVLQTSVVLDNNGTYELLKLFKDGRASLGVIKVPAPVTSIDQRGGSGEKLAPVTATGTSKQGAQLVDEYREKFYESPQSVSDLLTIQPARDDGGLRGYRVTPAKNVQDFKAIGFEPNDIITGVNGLSLLDASNGARLYEMMRDAQEITFDIERGSVPLMLTVTLQSELEE
jgi:general secretion pathway protein C